MKRRKVTAEKRIASERRRVVAAGHTSECARYPMPRIGDAEPCACLRDLQGFRA